jgi:hypothetical protein
VCHDGFIALLWRAARRRRRRRAAAAHRPECE